MNNFYIGFKKSGTSKLSLLINLSFLFCLIFLSFPVNAQQFVSNTAAISATGASFPFGGANLKVESTYLPADMSPAPRTGYITKVYFRFFSANAGTYSNVLIQMAQVPVTTSLSGTAFTTTPAPVTVYSAASLSITPTKGTWYSITLTTPFLYDATKTLTVITSMTAATGTANTLGYINSTSVARHRLYGTTQSALTGTVDNTTMVDFGYDVTGSNDAGVTSLSAPVAFCPGNYDIIVKAANLGLNNLSSLSVGWSFDGITQPYVSWPYKITAGHDTAITIGNKIMNPGVNHTLKVWTYNLGSATDSTPGNDTLFINTLGPGISGTYTINPSLGNSTGNFPSFTAAASFLNTYGVCGPLMLKISSGTYNEQVQLNSITGTSPVNTVTFDGMDSSKTILTYYGTAAAPYTLKFNGSAYVIVKRLSILNPSTSNAFAVHITGGANNITITNCIVKCDHFQSTVGTIVPIGIMGATYNATGNNGNNNIINNNIIDGGYANIIIYGTSTTALSSGNTVTNNKMTGAYTYGIYNFYQTGFTFSGNKIVLRVTATSGTSGSIISSTSSAGFAATYAIYVVSSANHIIKNNITSSSFQGIMDQNADVAVPGKTSMIYNNIVYGFLNTGSFGIYLNVGYNTAIYHNTVYFNAPSGNALYIVNTGATAAQGADVRNNILYKTSTSGFCAFVATASFVLTMDYNDYYSVSGNFVNFGGTPYPDLPSLMTASGSYNQHCQNADPGFANLTPGSEDFHMGSSSYGLSGSYCGISTDIDGDNRCHLFPNLGADETFFGKGKPVVKFFITSNIYAGSPSYVYQTGKAGEPKSYQWYLNGVFVSDSVVLKSSKFVAGSNTLKLVTQSCGGNDSFQQTFNVKAPTVVPVSDFIISKNLIAANDAVVFYDQSTNGPNAWQWQISPDSVVAGGAKVPSYRYVFGSAGYQNPKVQFNFAGTYSICLTASNNIGKGNKACKKNYISVLNSVNMGTAAIVTDAAGYLYDDGGPNAAYLGNKATPSILIAPCADSVYLTFSMFDISCGSAFMQIYEGKTTSGRRLDPCGGYGLISGYTGGPSSGILCPGACMPNVIKPDTIRAKSAILIQMNDGITASGRGFAAYWWSKPLTNGNKVKASFTVSGSGDSVCTNAQADFINTSNAGPNDIVSYLWDLDGDPTTFECAGACSNAFWPYFLTGPVNVTLIANSCGGSDTFSKTIMVYNPNAPHAKIQADNLTPAQGDVVFLSCPIIQCIETYKWTITKSKGSGTGYADFVNATHDYSSNPQVVFSDTGYYDVKLYVNNLSGAQEDSILLKNYIHVRNAYCIPSVAIINQGMGISGISLNTLINKMVQASKEYTNYTSDPTLTTTLNLGVKYPVSISRNSALNYDAINRSVFIDWNQDGSFTGAGEEAAKDSNSTSDTWNGYITVPRKAKTGATTMRIAVNKGNLSNKPCGQNEFGEYQDYRIYIIPYNILPVITLKGTQGLKDTIVLEQGTSFTETGYSASSVLYGDLTKFVKRISRKLNSSLPGDSFSNIVPAIYIFSYNLADSAGNKAITQYRVVQVVKDHTPPVLVIDKPDTTILEVTSSPVPFQAPKVISADDLIDGPLASSVVNDASKVTTNILGLYMITYSVNDLSGNTSKAYRYVKIIDTIAPVLKLAGNSPMDLEVNTPFTDPGFNASDNYYPATTLNPLVKIKSDLNNAVLGSYTIIYTLTDPSGNPAASQTRIVHVIDTLKPDIKLLGPATDSMEVFTTYNDSGVVVSDNYSDLSDITITISGTYNSNFPAGTAKITGSYSIIYTATDKAGNKSSVTRTVLVQDHTAPVIVLKGNSGISVCRWEKYVDEGYTFSDNYDKSSDIQVDTTGSFVTNGGTTIEGLLTLQYTATDKSGNIGYSGTRYIRVKSIQDWPCSNSGIQQASAPEKLFSIYPNPNNGQFTLAASIQLNEPVKIAVTNILGEDIVFAYEGTLIENRINIDLGNKPAGIYLIKIIYQNQISSKMITIAR
jgi:PKD repeat protein